MPGRRARRPRALRWIRPAGSHDRDRAARSVQYGRARPSRAPAGRDCRVGAKYRERSQAGSAGHAEVDVQQLKRLGRRPPLDLLRDAEVVPQRVRAGRRHSLRRARTPGLRPAALPEPSSSPGNPPRPRERQLRAVRLLHLATEPAGPGPRAVVRERPGNFSDQPASRSASTSRSSASMTSRSNNGSCRRGVSAAATARPAGRTPVVHAGDYRAPDVVLCMPRLPPQQPPATVASLGGRWQRLPTSCKRAVRPRQRRPAAGVPLRDVQTDRRGGCPARSEW